MLSSMVSSMPEKVRENRLRATAERRGLRLSKSRRRDPLAVDFGVYWLTDPTTERVVAECNGLDAVEDHLNQAHQ
jgi:hypothetical protein